MLTAKDNAHKRAKAPPRRPGLDEAPNLKVAPQAEAGIEGAGGRRTSCISPVAWIAVEDMDFGEWATAGRRLSAMGRCGQWGLGDWIRYGNSKFGERYAWAARVTGYDVQTLMNMVYVASRFDISRRRENLSWSHHETIAALDPVEQDRWLDRAVEDRLSISDLRGELRSLRKASGGGDGGRTEAAAAPEVIACPHCGGAVPLPSLRGGAGRRRASRKRPLRGQTPLELVAAER